jgi:putative peptidoglycan lipid II flippase
MAAPAGADSPGPAPRALGGGLAIAAAIVAFGFIGSRLLGIVRTVAIADAFGSSPELDAYNIAFRIPDLIFQVLAGATLGSAFIPVFARLYRRDGADAAWRLASHILNVVTVATAVLCVLAFIAAPLIVPLLAPGLGEDIGREEELTDRAVELTRIMLLSPFFFAMSGIVTGILNGRQRFLLTALSPILYNAAIIFGAVALSGRWGVNGLAVGVVVGSALHLLVQVPGLVRERMRWQRGFGRPRSRPAHGPARHWACRHAVQLRRHRIFRLEGWRFGNLATHLCLVARRASAGAIRHGAFDCCLPYARGPGG